jgi:hypothetical protein
MDPVTVITPYERMPGTVPQVRPQPLPVHHWLTSPPTASELLAGRYIQIQIQIMSARPPEHTLLSHNSGLIPARAPPPLPQRQSLAEDVLWYCVLCCVLQGPAWQAWWATRCPATACSVTPSTRRHAWSRMAYVSTRYPSVLPAIAFVFFGGGG